MEVGAYLVSGAVCYQYSEYVLPCAGAVIADGEQASDLTVS